MSGCLKPLRILAADDDVDAAEMYRVALEGRGHIITVAHDGQECLDSYTSAIGKLKAAGKKPSSNEPFDAVVLDYQMPIMDGLEVAKEILSINPEQRIIFASSFVKETLMESVRELNQVMELIQKPFEPDVLVDIVENVHSAGLMRNLRDIAGADASDTSDDQIQALLETLQKIQKAK